MVNRTPRLVIIILRRMQHSNTRLSNELSLWDSLLLEDRSLEGKNHRPTDDAIQFSPLIKDNFLKNVFKEKYVHGCDMQKLPSFQPEPSMDDEDCFEKTDSNYETVEQSDLNLESPPQIDYCVKNEEEVGKETACPGTTSQKASEHILKFKNIRKGWKKNTNVPKFFVRVYLKHFSAFNPCKKNKKYMQNHKKSKRQLRQIQSNNFKISHILALMKDNTGNNPEFCRNSRQIMASILRSQLGQEVLGNKCIGENRLSYMMASKIYALRCRSSTLTERVQLF